VSNAIKPIFAGNWKMNKLPGEPASYIQQFEALFGAKLSETEKCDIVLLVSSPLLAEAVKSASASKIKNLSIGAQNCHWEVSGAYTGEVSPQLLHRIGASYVILGHSERRMGSHEKSSQVGRKAARALELGLNVILCVGESLNERKSGEYLAQVAHQLKESLADVTPEFLASFGEQDGIAPLTIAYEPIWAIGTGVAAGIPEISEMHNHLRKTVRELGYNDSVRLIYGGSVSPDNIHQIIALEEVDGVLPGAASLDPEKFSKLILTGVGA
jgi:triosephosphate isomerase